MGLIPLNKRITLVALALSSSLLHTSAWGLEVTAENPSGPVKTSQADGTGPDVAGDVIIKPTGFINSANTVVFIDSVNALIIEPDNISASIPGLVTATSGNAVDASSQGSITVGANSGILLQNSSDNAIRLLNAPNFAINNSGSIRTNGTGSAIRVQTSNNTTLTNFTGGIVSGNDDAIRIVNASNFILINQADATIEGRSTGTRTSALEFTGGSGIINNSGTISMKSANAEGGAIYTDAGASTVVVNNLVGGSILSPGSNGIHVRSKAAASNYTVNNAGLISAGRNGINFPLINTGNITNSATGVINAGLTVDSGIGINLIKGMTGNILNDGAITAKNRGIFLGGVFTGNLTNNGSITVADNTNGSSALYIDNTLTGNLTNTGTMSSINEATLFLSNVGAGITGDVINSGTISQLGTGAAPTNAVRIDDVIGGKFDNQGTISTTVATQPAIYINGDVAGGIFNSGNITGVAGNVAIEIDSGSDFTQTAGTITGHISLDNNNTATFTGGTVDGDIRFTNGGGTGVLNIGNTNVTGTIFSFGGDTMNVTGNLTTNGGVGPFDTTNINAGTWTANGTISARGVGVFNVNNNSTLDLNSLFTAGVGLVTLTVDNNATFNVNSGASINNGSGINLVQNGTMTIAQSSPVDINSIMAGATSVFNLTFTDLNKFSNITLNAGGSDVSNSTYNVTLTGEGFIAQGDQFKVIDSQANGVAGMGTINIGQPSSLTLSFTEQSTADEIILQAERAPFQGLTNTPNSDAAATALDVIVNDPNLSQDLKLAISQIDILPTIDEVSAAIEALLPDTSGGMVEISQDVFNRGLFTVEGRIQEARSWADILANTMPAGDEPYYGLGAWGKVFASSASQKNVDVFPGYTSRAVGFSTGFDKSFTDDLMLGAAFTYTSAEVEGKQRAPNEVDVNSLQLIGYGTVSSGALYFDGLVSAALNNYKSSRMIEIGSFRRVAKANYKAWQYAGKFELGYTIANGKYRIEPIVGGQYTMLDTDGYTESTGGGINLAVQPRKVHDFIGSVGLRLSSLNEYVEALYVPEFRAYLSHDFIRDNILTNENFVSNGAILFETRSAKPDAVTYNLGGALSAYTHNLILAVNYDISFRNQYIGHYGSFKIRYEW